MKFNTKLRNKEKTVNLAGGEAFIESPKLHLVSVLATSMLQDQHYRNAEEGMAQVVGLIDALPDKQFAAKAALYARNELGLRSITHVVAGEIARTVKGEDWTKRFFEKIVRRPDDMMEILAYWYARGGRTEPNALKKGFAAAFEKFDAYQLAKYRAEGSDVSLVDVANLVHPKPTEKNADALRKLVAGELHSEGTWESELTKAGQNGEPKEQAKAEAWKQLVLERKIGYFALLRNLRNILQAAPEVVNAATEMLTDENLIRKSLVMPFRFSTAFDVISAITVDGASDLMSAISEALDKSLANVPRLPGKTLVVLDDSGSMCGKPIRIGSLFAAALYKAMDAHFMRFSDDASYRNFDRRNTVLSMAQDIQRNMKAAGTNFHAIFNTADKPYDRIIILSDMQGWMGYYAPTTSFAQYKRRTGAEPIVYSFDLQGYGTLMFPERNVFCLAGISDKVFDVMKLLESDKEAMVHTIEAVEL